MTGLLLISLSLVSVTTSETEFNRLFEHVETIELDDSHLLGNHPRLTVDQKGEQFVIGDVIQDEVLLFNDSGDFISQLDPEPCFPGADWSPEAARGVAFHNSGDIMVTNRYPYAVWFDENGQCTHTFSEETEFSSPGIITIIDDYIIAIYVARGASEKLQKNNDLAYHVDILDLDGSRIETIYKEYRYSNYLRGSRTAFFIDNYENEAILGIRTFPEVHELKPDENGVGMTTIPARPSFFREFGDDVKDSREIETVQELARINREFIEDQYVINGIRNVGEYVVFEYSLGLEKNRSYAVMNNKGNVQFEYHVDHPEELSGDPMGVTYFDDSCDRYLYSLHHPENVDGSGEGSMNPSIKVYKLNTGELQ